MESAVVFLQEMLMLYGITALGFITRKSGILDKHANDVLTQLILYITLPALILFSLDIRFSVSLAKEFTWLIAMSVYILMVSCVLAFWMRQNARLPAKQKSVYEGLIIFGNQGFIGYAVSFILLGEKGIVYLTIFNLCYLILIWTYGVYLFHQNNAKTINWKNILLNPGILSTLAGITIFLFPISFPDIVSTGLESVGKMTIPLSMILIGSLIANIPCKEFFILIKNSYLWKAAASKLVLLPATLFIFAFFSVPLPVLLIAVIVSGMPSAPTITLYSQRYGGDTLFASIGVLLTTILCILTIPFLYFMVGFLHN
nr:AEC family transporter [Virgibacillus siamensis]